MSSVIENLVKLGLKEYEAKIYVALAGIGEANARTIHEVSGVPRPRVYDILGELTAKGFVEVRDGSPFIYRSVPPDVVISQLQKEMNQAAEESIASLETLSLKGRQEYVPIWHVKGDWSINRHLKALIDRVTENLFILANDDHAPERYASLIGEATKKCAVKILLKADSNESFEPVTGASYYEIGKLNPHFREYIFDKIFTHPVIRDNAVFALECSFLSDDRELMIIYTLNGERMAFINTSPFITTAQSMAFAHMIKGAHKIECGVGISHLGQEKKCQT